MSVFKDEWLVKPLIKKGILEPDVLEEIRRSSVQGVQEYLSDKIITMGYLTQADLGNFLEEMFNIPYVDLDNTKINKKASEIVPEEICRKYKVFPYFVDNEYITIATFDPMNLEAEREISYISARMVQTTIGAKTQIVEKINEFYAPDKLIDNLAERISLGKDDDDNMVEEDSPTQKIDVNKTDAPIVRLVNSVLSDAIENDASDIHIEPTEKKVMVRFRIDGILKKVMDVPKYAQPQLISRIKIISNLDIAETRKPQDGKAKVKKRAVSVDLRVSILPTSYGEKAVIRILDPRKANVPFEKLGITGENLEKLTKVLSLKQGIILATGPTGSGKTTTLYSALNKIKSGTTNILTVEDPIEYMLEGINQVQVNEKAGVTFASALRSFLRQDPDVILVGEIRDRETAEISIQASLTGHLVLSTLHTNSAIETVTRLIDVGVDGYKVASALSAVIAQRLVRRICPNCREAKEPDFSEKQIIPLMLNYDYEPKFFEGKGCPNCDYTGYKGRVGVYEILIFDKPIKESIIRGKSLPEVEQVAIEHGFKTFTMSALDLITEGISSYNEITRVISLEDSRKPEKKKPTENIIPKTEKPAAPELSKTEEADSQVETVESEMDLKFKDETPIEKPVSKTPPISDAPKINDDPNRKKKILVVEDDTIMRKLIKRILTKDDRYEVFEVSNGKAALQKLDEFMPDLMILDIMMPIMDGYEVCKQVRANDRYIDMPIIMLTALDDKANHLKGLELGGDDYITKPFDANILLARVISLFRRFQLHKPR